MSTSCRTTVIITLTTKKLCLSQVFRKLAEWTVARSVTPKLTSVCIGVGSIEPDVATPTMVELRKFFISSTGTSIVDKGRHKHGGY